jgi:ribosomal protein L15E
MRLERLATVVAAICLLSLLGVLFLDRPAGAKRVPSVLRVRTLELVDRQGQARAQITVERSGEVVFRMRDQRGQVRVKLGASRTGSGLLLLNEATEPGIQALAGEQATSLSLQRGSERNELVP